MKEALTDANFPRTADGRVYHLGVRAGEVANRIITVGPPARARSIARLLAAHPPPFVLESERGFLTITGLYAGTPVSVIAIGMGAANMDFFVREARECVSGDMVILRLGSCGGLLDSLPVGSIVVPRASVAITRNYDFDFVNPREGEEKPYRVSKPTQADPALHDAIVHAFNTAQPTQYKTQIRGDVVNASADSFYSSQGRQTSFPDHNSDLIENLLQTVDGLASFEMETFHLLHLAASWYDDSPSLDTPSSSPTVPVHHLPVSPSVTAAYKPSAYMEHTHASNSKIRAASAHMVFAARTSRDFITPEHVHEIEVWSGRVALDALAKFEIAPEKVHRAEGSVWEVR